VEKSLSDARYREMWDFNTLLNLMGKSRQMCACAHNSNLSASWLLTAQMNVGLDFAGCRKHAGLECVGRNSGGCMKHGWRIANKCQTLLVCAHHSLSSEEKQILSGQGGLVLEDGNTKIIVLTSPPAVARRALRERSSFV
jgi:hypothetical protein